MCSNKAYKSPNGLYKHEKMHTDPKLICAVCGRIFKSVTELNRHMPVHDDSKKVACEDCGKLFSSKHTKKCHVEIHLNLQIPCSSPDCASSFATKDRAQHHYQGSHGEGYTTLCGKFTYQWPGKCSQHQRDCDDCKKKKAEKHFLTFSYRE